MRRRSQACGSVRGRFLEGLCTGACLPPQVFWRPSRSDCRLFGADRQPVAFGARPGRSSPPNPVHSAFTNSRSAEAVCSAAFRCNSRRKTGCTPCPPASPEPRRDPRMHRYGDVEDGNEVTRLSCIGIGGPGRCRPRSAKGSCRSCDAPRCRSPPPAPRAALPKPSVSTTVAATRATPPMAWGSERNRLQAVPRARRLGLTSVQRCDVSGRSGGDRAPTPERRIAGGIRERHALDGHRVEVIATEVEATVACEAHTRWAAPLSEGL